ncbi:uncharacterized protein EV422DRAFT_516755 [Fimicolochytrium jonesii]|uniref:uncharacterized protein n=1 Tax=Fimicolochytrium jonesii TaxID=1396493 RepID=UPI0022FDE061|nr:uncharacterized protein EV422DRAFT_516755 [Fimicolochytrium jonesii]KAI8824912.1 hypothetical protein EV422DRAFT_516755 [Fimicolochytrium jonesii]
MTSIPMTEFGNEGKGDSTTHLHTDHSSNSYISSAGNTNSGAQSPHYRAAPHQQSSLLGRLTDSHLHNILDDPELLTTSYVVSSKTLFRFRLFGLFWVIFIVPFQLRRDQETYLFYFTQLTWLGLGAWFAVAAFQTYRCNRDGNMSKFLRQSRFTQWLTWALYVMPATFHWIVPIVFWGLLSSSLVKDGDGMAWWSNINVHLFDFVLVFIELCINRIPLFYTQWPIIVIPGLLFLAYAFVQHAAYHISNSPSGWWVYSFLDTSKNGAWVYYVVLPLGFILVFLLVTYVHKLRDRRREKRVVRA